MRLVAGEAGNLFVVGDEDQSIYRWRGADVSNILEFAREFPTAKTVRLERNYRSTAPILKAAGAVVAENRRRLGKTLRADEDGRRERPPRRLRRGARRGARGRLADRGRAPRTARGRDRGPFPHERAVPAVRGRAPALEHALHPRRRDEVLRKGRDQGRARVPAPREQPVRRRVLPEGRERAGARRGRGHAGGRRGRGPRARRLASARSSTRCPKVSRSARKRRSPSSGTSS